MLPSVTPTSVPARVDGPRGRVYVKPDGTEFVSATTVLGVLAKPQLAKWAVNVELEHAAEVAAALRDEMALSMASLSRDSYRSALLARIGQGSASDRIMREASALGTSVHASIEWEERQQLGLPVGKKPILSEKGLHAFAAYRAWRKEYRLTPSAVEEVVWSDTHRYAGTLDLRGEVDLGGKRVSAVIDWKVSTRIYPEASLQNAAYVHALLEMGLVAPPVVGLIVRLPRTASDHVDVKVIPYEQHEALFQTFLATKALWEWRNQPIKKVA